LVLGYTARMKVSGGGAFRPSAKQLRSLQTPPNLATGLTLCSLLVLAAVHCRVFTANAVDDAFITFR
jgi:hypothetical protein